MTKKTLIATLAFVTVSFPVGNVAHALVVEDFESGRFQAPWIDAGNGGFSGTPTPMITASGAHDGRLGVEDGDGNWLYRTDAAASIATGSSLSAWFRTYGAGFGILHLGFAADSRGTSGFTIMPYFNKISFQNNDGYMNFVDTAAQTFTFEIGKWYLARVDFGGTITGNIYATNGTTLLASLTATGLTRGATGGIAVRGVGELNYDTISVTPAAVVSAVPEPTSWAMMITGFGFAGAAIRRRRATSPVGNALNIRADCA